MGGAFADNGCAVFYTAGEADREMAQYCRDTPSCGALLGKDSDFFVLPVARYLPLDSLDLRASVPRVTVYRRADVLDALQLDEPLLPLLASLVGNDFVPTDVLDAFHRALVGPDRHASGQPLILAVAALLRSAAASTGWCGGLPLPPLLWDALDFARRLPEGGKALVETLDRYFENVCELDIMFNLEKAHFILDEMVMNGCIIETNKNNILAPVHLLDKAGPT